MGKLWRVKRGGKFIGSFRVTIKGREINLGTKDATEALRRAKLAARGLWPQEENAAAAVAAAFDVRGGSELLGAHNASETGSTPVPATRGGEGGSVPPVPAADDTKAAEGPAPLIPEVVQPAQNWAADAGAAAAEDSPGAGPAGEAPPEGVKFGAFDLSGMIDTAAHLAVELQLRMQEYLILRYGKRVAGQVAIDDPMRALAIEGWRQQLKIWLPTDIPIPAWAVGLGLAASCAVTQFATSTPIPKDGAQASAT